MTSQKTTVQTFGTGLRPVAVRLAAVSLMVLGLAACRNEYTGGRVVGFTGPETVEERHPIVVEKHSKTLEIAVWPGSTRMTDEQRADVESFLGRWRTGGAGTLMVQAPRGSANEGAAYAIATEIREIANGVGIDGGAISFRAYHSRGSKPSIKLSFLGYVATGPDCGAWPTNVAENKQNDFYENYGCAAQANLAAMVSNPEDLLHPRRMTSRPAQRRDVAWDAYVSGETTTSEKTSEELKGTISEVGQ